MSTWPKAGNIVLIALTLFYLVMLGGGTYEHMNITPVITKSLPQSLQMIQGPYGFNPVKFWGIFRPITILLFVASIVLCWKQPGISKRLLFVAFAIDVLITLSTFLYFAPEVGVIVSVPVNGSIDPSIQDRAHLWKNLNGVRLGAFYAVSILLLIALNTNRQRSIA